MSAPVKTWCLGAVVAINALLAPSLVYTWLHIYREYSYPIDFFLPINRTSTRAAFTLCVAAVTMPLSCVLYSRTARDLSPPTRIASVIITIAAAFVAIAFACRRAGGTRDDNANPKATASCRRRVQLNCPTSLPRRQRGQELVGI